MPFQMSYTTPDNVTHPNSYWRFKYLTSDGDNKTTTGTFRVWHDKASHDAGAQPLGVLKSYQFTGALHDALVNTQITAGDVGNTLFGKISALAETEALATHDTQSGGLMVSFFSAATQVP